jgi:uncharacterized membrane protein
VIATTLTGATGWWITGDAATGVSIGLADCVVKSVAYYIHESFWDRR